MAPPHYQTPDRPIPSPAIRKSRHIRSHRPGVDVHSRRDGAAVGAEGDHVVDTSGDADLLLGSGGAGRQLGVPEGSV